MRTAAKKLVCLQHIWSESVFWPGSGGAGYVRAQTEDHHGLLHKAFLSIIHHSIRRTPLKDNKLDFVRASYQSQYIETRLFLLQRTKLSKSSQ